MVEFRKDIFSLDDNKVFELIEKYGSPLYIYSEKVLRQSCKEMHDLVPNKNFRISYSAKANSNLELMKIVHSEDIDSDAMSIGEIYTQELAGFSPEQIFFIPNNVSAEEMQYAIDKGILVSVDSLSQLETFGKINRGGKVAIRFNPSKGLGHSEKVVTAGKKTKFGVEIAKINEVKEILAKYDLQLVGINCHLGSLVMVKEPYIAGVKEMLELAMEFPGLEVIDFGGGFGVPYKNGEDRLDLENLGNALDKLLTEFLAKYDNKDVMFRAEPGRYIPGECGVLVGTVTSLKENYGNLYLGCDLGFNNLMRPVMYNSYHEIEVVQKNKANEKETYTIVGNICESGDILGKDRELSKAEIGDLVVAKTAGAYGYSMASNYNQRLRPAEVLIDLDGNDKLMRRRDTYEDLVSNMIEV